MTRIRRVEAFSEELGLTADLRTCFPDIYKQLLDKLDVIECFESPGRSLRVEEILTKQEVIYEALNVSIPASS
ncbi:hypothetical protein [Fusibacter sp. 3D3]|uniref:hypothetical protein n=1 Tax=Fusibacter sp. 3D3 TaxID=1048380 RepID=UPI000853D56C|nr:hypothetical protein [Fusibacter sp. 3D3]GAU77880.1 transposase, IS4 [Fusibacter sp. 3D3]